VLLELKRFFQKLLALFSISKILKRTGKQQRPEGLLSQDYYTAEERYYRGPL
jgi:hypothetical protein